MVSTPLGLYTDLYEVRMVSSYLRHGMTDDATFSLFIRPTARRPWFVALGIGRVLDVLSDFRYGPDELAYLRSIGIDEPTLDYLAALEVTGDVHAMPDGTIVLADEPILEVTAPLPIAQLIETAAINLVQLSTLVATKAARVVLAADGRPVVDFGFRRAHGLDTGVEAARAAYIAGAASTSNLEAGRRYGLPVSGTMAHSFVQSFTDELDAFRTFARDHPDDCVLLVDTYDTLAGVRKAIVVADELRDRGSQLRAVRLDSGDLLTLSRAARELLDAAGHHAVQILASGGLDEFDVARLVGSGAPIDAFGVGTDLVTSSDRPSLDIAYKLVAYAGRPVAKYSEGKRTFPGAKQVFRTDGPQTDVLGLRDEGLSGDALLEPVWRNGEVLRELSVEEARARVRQQIDALPDGWKVISETADGSRPRLSEGLERLD